MTQKSVSNRQIKLRVLLLTTVSGIVLLSGCETYKGLHDRLLAERPEQTVEGGRHAPVLNPQGARSMPAPRMAQAPAAPAAAPAPSRAPVAQTEEAKQAAAAANPYDNFDQYGNEGPQPVTAPAQPSRKVVTADDAHFVSGNNMNPPATGSKEKDGGTALSRMFSSNNAGNKGDDARRKPIPGNPQYDTKTDMVAPVPQGPLADTATASVSSSSRNLADETRSDMKKSAEPVKLSGDEEKPAAMQPLAEMKQPENTRFDDSAADSSKKTAIDDSKPAPVADTAPMNITPQAYPKAAAVAVPTPQGKIPLVDAMPMDPEEGVAPAPVAPLTSPRSEAQPAPESIMPSMISSAQAAEPENKPQMLASASAPAPEAEKDAPAANTVMAQADMAAAPAQSSEKAPSADAEVVSAPKSESAPVKDSAAKDDDMFKPQTNYAPKEDGETVVVSSLADKKAKPEEKKSFFGRMFGSDNTATAKKTDSSADMNAAAQPAADATAAGDNRNWFERQVGFKSARPEQEARKDYPNFNTVPTKPERMGAIKDEGEQPVHEMETMRDQAQESKMELGSEPSGADMAPVAPPKEEAAQEPMQPQLLGHVTAPADTVKTEAAKTEMSKPVEVTKTLEQPVAETGKPVLPPMPAQPAARAVVVPPSAANAPAMIAPMTMDGSPEPMAQPQAAMPVPAAEPAAAAEPAPAAAEPVRQTVREITPPPAVATPAPMAMPLTAPAPQAEIAKPQAEAEPKVQADDKAADAAKDINASDASAANAAANDAAAGAPAAAMSPSAPDHSGKSSQSSAEPASPATTSTGLPSPGLLDKVRVLPPSRYESRSQQHSSEE